MERERERDVLGELWPKSFLIVSHETRTHSLDQLGDVPEGKSEALAKTRKSL